jgi:hypothetical protein
VTIRLRHQRNNRLMPEVPSHLFLNNQAKTLVRSVNVQN